jgi:SAM-dependent methyltransferase
MSLYNSLKKWIPRSLQMRWEPQLRWLSYQLGYRGNQFKCPVCQAKLRTFIKLESGDLLCPSCGSLPRNRRLWILLQDLIQPGMQILHFSPSRPLRRRLENWKGIQYTSTDYASEFPADKQLDITQIDEPDHKYDLIICFHVLEHIPQDKKALSELYRILKPGGKCLIQTPFKSGEIYEDFSITSPADRLIHFGQEDHVRIYSVEGLAQRARDAGFQVEILRFSDSPANEMGLKEREEVLVFEK